MAEFVYKGRSMSGALVAGRLHGEDSNAVAGRLVSIGVTPIEITAATEQGGVTVGELWRRMGGDKPTTKDLVLFCRQMYTITKAGLPLLRGLTGLMETTHNIVLKETLVEVIASLQSGRGLAQSLGRHPQIFSDLFINIVQIGENTGTLDTAFLRMYEYLSTDQEIRDRVKSALRYPVIVLIAVAVAIAIITVFVIPNFAPIFRKLGDDIPLPTMIIMGVSDFAVNHWGLLLIGMAAVAAGVSWYTKTEAGRANWDRLKLQIPVTGVIVHNAAMSRITRSLAVSLEAGLPINDTLRMIAGAIGNVHLMVKMSQLSEGIERGESLSDTATAAGLFTPLILQMIALGEETGELPQLMNEAADYYRREVDYDLENLSAALEPILIIAVGGVVLVLALGVFLPMWDMVARTKAG
jgi:MSHA biogenesis protein MshG